jgi:hypothetical protein
MSLVLTSPGCMLMILDNAVLQGQPHFPHDMVEVSGVIKEHHVRFVYIDPSLVLPERFGRSKRSPTRPVDDLAVA